MVRFLVTVLLPSACAMAGASTPFMYTEAPRYDPQGGERFPSCRRRTLERECFRWRQWCALRERFGQRRTVCWQFGTDGEVFRPGVGSAQRALEWRQDRWQAKFRCQAHARQPQAGFDRGRKGGER